MSLLLFLLLTQVLLYETLEDVQQIQSEALHKNCFQNSQEKLIWLPYAGRNPPLMEKTHALLPSCNGLEKPLPER